jgi:hypothetical protein
MVMATEGVEELNETRRRRGAGGQERTGRGARGQERTGREGEDGKEWLGGEELSCLKNEAD